MKLQSYPDGQESAKPERRCSACSSVHFSWLATRSDGVSVLLCQTCGLGVVESIPAHLESYYDDAYYGADDGERGIGYEDYAFTSEHGLSWAASLIRFIKPAGRILDIGCTDGTLLSKLPTSFERYGIEVNPRMAARAAVRAVRIIGSDLLDPAVSQRYRGSFDVVSSIAVFEHLSDFRRGFEISLELLKPSGVLVFEVPYVSAQYDNRVWFESSLEHVYYPSGNCIERLIEGLGSYLVGREINIRGYASNYIGIAFRDQETARGFASIFDALTSVVGQVSDPALREVRQQLMLMHAATSSPDVLSGLRDMPVGKSPTHVMRRFEQIWHDDLVRLTTENRALQAQLAEYLAQQAQLMAAVAEYKYRNRHERQQLNSKLSALTAALRASQSEMDSFLNSDFWKATYPLRRIAVRYPGVMRVAIRLAKLIWWSMRLELRNRLRQPLTQSAVVPPAEVLAVGAPETAEGDNPPVEFSTQTCFPKCRLDLEDIDPWPPGRPLVSVIVPSFNYGRFVEAAVDSVLAQTFTNIEVIVVEGGSTDADSRERTLLLDRPRTRVIAQDTPNFVGANRNFGISHARGKYVCCLDADDMIAPTYIEKAVFLLETHGYDVVSCGLQFFGSRFDRVNILQQPTLADMLESNHMLTSAVFRRKLWADAGGFRDVDPSVHGHFHEDWLFWAHLAALGARMWNMDREYLFLYRRHGPSISTQNNVRSDASHRAVIRQMLNGLLGPEALLRSKQAAATPSRRVDPLRNLIPIAQRSDRMVLLLALPFTIIGGAERLLSGVVQHLAKQGWEILVTTSIDPGDAHGDSTPWFEAGTSEIYHLPRFLPTEDWRDFVRYLIASRGVKVVWVVGSAFMYDLLPDLHREFLQLAVADLLFNTIGHTQSNLKYQEYIAITFVESQEVRQFLCDANVPDNRIALVQSGVDLLKCVPAKRDLFVTEVLDVAPDELIVGFSGRWSEEKAPLAFVEIARRSSHLPIRFVMTGTGALRQDVESAVASAAFPEGRFHLIGDVADVYPWLRSYDVLVLPSRLDGRPVVVLEALAHGVPVLASRVGGLPELIEHGVTGFLCQPAEVDEFVEHLAKLANDPDLLARMKKAARGHAERHLDVARMFARYEEKLLELAAPENATQQPTAD